MNVREISNLQGTAPLNWALLGQGQGHIVSLHQLQPVKKTFHRWLKKLG